MTFIFLIITNLLLQPELNIIYEYFVFCNFLNVGYVLEAEEKKNHYF